jgi:hypothetical protein
VPVSESERFKDAVAFARAATNYDWEGCDVIMSGYSHYADVMIPLAWILKALVDSSAKDRDLPVDTIWASVLESIESTQVEEGNDEGSGD